MSAAIWRVLAPGALTTVQDRGRDGWRHLGLARAGALDPAMAALANRLVGNAADAAVLELTLRGPTLALTQPARIALCGAEADARFEHAHDAAHPVPNARPVDLPAGTLHLGTVRGGLRAWLAVAGGFDLPPVLGSRSTDLRGGFGGLEGRALRAGDTLPIGETPPIDCDAPRAPSWWLAPEADLAADVPIRYVPADGTDTALADREWRVDPRSDRQGLRLDGAPLPAAGAEQLSAPVAPGTIQLPPDGRPIVLLADAQTVGGYPRLGHVIAADLPRLAQRRAGDALRFAAVDAATAEILRRARRDAFARAVLALETRGVWP
jgi:antagonist of KipI